MPTPLGIIASQRSGSTPPLVLSHTGTVYTASAATSYVSPSYSPAASSHLWLAYLSRHGTTAPRMIPNNAYGGTWVELGGGAQVDGITAVGCWELQCSASPGSGTITVNTAGGVTALGYAFALIQAVNHNPVGTTVQFVFGPTGSGTSGTSSLITLASAGSVKNGEICFVGIRANEALTAEAGWTPGGAGANNSGPNVGVLAEYKVGSFDTSCTETWTTAARYQGLALEVKAA